MRDVLLHTPSHVKKAKIGGSQIFQKLNFLIFLASPRIFLVKRPVWWRVARKTSSQTRLEREIPLDAIDEGNDSKT
jgi:hypothetical protein